MFAIALPFLAAFLLDRKNTWGLIVAFILAAVGFVPLLTISEPDGEMIGAYVMFAVAIPFWITYFLSRRSWWAVIPAGIMTSVGLIVALIGLGNFDTATAARLNGLMSLGVSATFFLVWLRRATDPVDWAKYPAGFFLIMGLFGVLFGESIDLFWPFVLIALGVYVLFQNLRPKHA